MKFLLSAAFLILIFGCTPVKNSSYRAGPEEAFVNLKPYAVGGSFTVYGSPEKLIKKINELGGAQGDLETNSAFSERMSKLGNSAVISKVDNYQIKFDKDTGKISYEARIEDAQEWGFRAKGQSMIEYDKRYLSLSLPETTYSKGEYVGQNSFGVKAVVGVVDIDRVYLVSPAIPKESRGVLFVKLIADLDISLSELESQKENLALAVMFEPVPSYVRMSKTYGKATIQNKTERTVNNYFLTMKIAGVSIINNKTNKIYSPLVRLKFNSL